MKSKSIYKDHCIDYGLIYGPKMVQQKTKPLIPYGIQGFKGGLKQIRTRFFKNLYKTTNPLYNLI
jgi:hypothetical protein